jgi:hypothetical protein
MAEHLGQKEGHTKEAKRVIGSAGIVWGGETRGRRGELALGLGQGVKLDTEMSEKGRRRSSAE